MFVLHLVLHPLSTQWSLTDSMRRACLWTGEAPTRPRPMRSPKTGHIFASPGLLDLGYSLADI